MREQMRWQGGKVACALLMGGLLSMPALGRAQTAAPAVPWPPAPARLTPASPLPTQTAPVATALAMPIPATPGRSGPSAQAMPVVMRVPAPSEPAGAVPTMPATPETYAALQALRVAMAREVPNQVTITPQRRALLERLARERMAAADRAIIDHPQLFVVVDRNARYEELWIMLGQQSAPWEVVGGTHVSTGQPGRFDHYITPVGVFPNTSDILGYRAEGTYNENHVRGLGVKGMRVWDFGWQMAQKGWRSDQGNIRLEMHATDPAVLAQRIGRPASSGCIRVPDALNHFMDRHGVIDADDERAAVDDIRFRALLLRDRTPTPLAGTSLIVVDSGTPG